MTRQICRYLIRSRQICLDLILVYSTIQMRQISYFDLCSIGFYTPDLPTVHHSSMFVAPKITFQYPYEGLV